MVLDEKNNREEQVLSVAKSMMAAARTAPKGKGIDIQEIITVSGEDLKKLADEMRRYSEESGFKFFLRDAGNVEMSQAVVIIGTKQKIMSLNCGYCGFQTCGEKEKYPTVPCAINITDVGIALGSAASIAADQRIDSRIMYSVGLAALRLGLLKDCTAAYAITLSCASKSPFFDRVAHKPDGARIVDNNSYRY